MLTAEQRENELIRKQKWSGVSVVFRAERSSDPAEVTAGMEEGDWRRDLLVLGFC